MKRNGATSLHRNSLFIFSVLLLFSHATTLLGQTAMQAEVAIPEQYSGLYRTLEQNLKECAQRYPMREKEPKPLVCPTLFSAASVFNPSAENPERWREVVAT